MPPRTTLLTTLSHHLARILITLTLVRQRNVATTEVNPADTKEIGTASLVNRGNRVGKMAEIATTEEALEAPDPHEVEGEAEEGVVGAISGEADGNSIDSLDLTERDLRQLQNGVAEVRITGATTEMSSLMSRILELLLQTPVWSGEIRMLLQMTVELPRTTVIQKKARPRLLWNLLSRTSLPRRSLWTSGRPLV
uniref:Uncharacterized protein n=1 Tax=Cacopsylla melanoneura TaxID=428564 RepID=A0A8D8QC70_9HEMI